MVAALTDIRILDLTRLLPGPYCTQLLADLGADVIKIEDPAILDYLRVLPPTVGGVGASFAAINRGKRSVALNLKEEDARSRFLTLCEDADVLVESFRPGVMERLGLGPDVLRSAFPQLTYCRISGYGQEGPDAHRAGHDINYVARAGVLGLARDAVVLPVQVADLVGGAYLPAIQILAALIRRSRCGEGATIDAAMIDGAWSMCALPLARHLANGEPVRPGGGWLTGAIPAYNVYHTADGALAVGALEPKFWEPLCKAVGRPDLTTEGMTTGADGQRVQAELRDLFATRTTAEWMSVLGPLDCCVEPVVAPERAAEEDPALRRRALLAEVTIDGERATLPLTPVVVGEDVRRRDRPPKLGEHTAILAPPLDERSSHR